MIAVQFVNGTPDSTAAGDSKSASPAHTAADSSSSSSGQFSLLALDWMLAPIVRRFRFHFAGKRPTNRLDRPEWLFSFVLVAIRDHSDFLQVSSPS